MTFRKRNQPGCTCCTPAACTTIIHVNACFAPAVGASITVKTAGGTIVATATTNSSGDASVNLAGYVGQTLYAYVTYMLTDYNPYTGVLLGNFCGRTYFYTLDPISDTVGASCGTISITTTQCDGFTLLGGKAWTLQKASAGGWSTYATGTTDATTAKSTVTGLTYGGAYDYYRFLVTDAVGGVTGTTIILTSTNCVASCLMRMATSSRLPCTTPQDSIAYSGGGGISYQRVCCSACAPGSTHRILYFHDPYPSSPVMSSTGTCGTGCSFSPASVTPMSYTYNPNQWCCPTGPYDYSCLSCNGSTVTLFYSKRYKCSNVQPRILSSQWWSCGADANYGFGVVGISGTVNASTLTCSPFSATFNIPATTINCYKQTSTTPMPVCGTILVPAHTITITE